MERMVPRAHPPAAGRDAVVARRGVVVGRHARTEEHVQLAGAVRRAICRDKTAQVR